MFNGEKALQKMRHERAKRIKNALSQYGYSFNEQKVFKAIENIRLKCNKIRDTVHKEFGTQEVMKMTLEKLGVHSLANVKNLSKIYSNAILSMRLNLQDGTLNLLKLLKQKGIKIGIISNTEHEHGEIEKSILESFNITQYFDSMTFSCDVGLRKPKTEIFKKAVDLLNAIPNETVHVGDRPEIDVLGAKQSGLKAVYLKVKDRPYPPDLPQPDATIKTLAQIPKILEEVLNG